MKKTLKTTTTTNNYSMFAVFAPLQMSGQL